MDHSTVRYLYDVVFGSCWVNFQHFQVLEKGFAFILFLFTSMPIIIWKRTVMKGNPSIQGELYKLSFSRFGWNWISINSRAWSFLKVFFIKISYVENFWHRYNLFSEFYKCHVLLLEFINSADLKLPFCSKKSPNPKKHRKLKFLKSFSTT